MIDREKLAGDGRADAVLELQLGKVQTRFAAEEWKRAPYPNELPRLEPVRRQLARIGEPLVVVPFVSETSH